MNLVMISKEEWEQFKIIQTEILERVRNPAVSKDTVVPVDYITAKEFMEAVRIKRTKFDQLIQTNKIKIIKKKRKIYVPVKEVEKYFGDSSIL